jgi:hypothetical protein
MTMAERVERARALVDQAAGRAPAVLHHATDDLFPDVDGLPDVHLSELTVDRLASGIQHHGGMVVRELLATDQVEGLRTQLRDGTLRAKQGGASSSEVDHMVAMLIEAYRTQGVLALAERYLGEAPVGFPHRTVVKRNEPSAGLPWHQDASFFRGPCGSLDVWTALTECGRTCPSLWLVPRRIERILDESQTTVDASATVEDEMPQVLEGVEAVRPVLQPGDAILLDEMTVHRTGTGWKAPSREVAVTWFFAPSRLPAMTARPIAF